MAAVPRKGVHKSSVESSILSSFEFNAIVYFRIWTCRTRTCTYTALSDSTQRQIYNLPIHTIALFQTLERFWSDMFFKITFCSFLRFKRYSLLAKDTDVSKNIGVFTQTLVISTC